MSRWKDIVLNYPELQTLESIFTGAERNEARGGDTPPVLSYAYYLQAHATYLDSKNS